MRPIAYLLGAVVALADLAVKAYREGKPPFPDGAMIARLAWSYVSSEENNKVFGRPQSFVAGAPINLQFMVKESGKYAATGGWGFAQLKDGKPAGEALPKTCFPCMSRRKRRTSFSLTTLRHREPAGMQGTPREYPAALLRLLRCPEPLRLSRYQNR